MICSATVSTAKRLLTQQRQDKHKLYALHAPLVVGAQSLAGTPHDSRRLKEALRQVHRLTSQKPERCYVDLGYRGHGVKDIQVFTARQKRGVTRSIRRELKRRNAIEPIIGHMKNDGLLRRNYLKGAEGDAINVILCGAGQNLRLILRQLRIFWLKIRAAFDRHWQTDPIGAA